MLELRGAQDSHTFRADRIDLAVPDVFPNTTQIAHLNQEQEKFALILGKQAVHRLDVTSPAGRSFSIEFEIGQ